MHIIPFESPGSLLSSAEEDAAERLFKRFHQAPACGRGTESWAAFSRERTRLKTGPWDRRLCTSWFSTGEAVATAPRSREPTIRRGLETFPAAENPHDTDVVECKTLCRSCSLIEFTQDYSRAQKRSHDCWMCRFLTYYWKRLATHVPYDLRIRGETSSEVWDAQVSVNIERSRLQYAVGGGDKRVEFEIFRGAKSSSTSPNIAFRGIDPDPLSEGSLHIIQSWLTDCQRTHERCLRLPDSFTMPTRLIDINGPAPYLREFGPGDVSKLPYVTLSHCWGSSAFLKTTRSNLMRHKRGMGLEDLPQSFRDAISVTRNLGFCLIWIDSLCIIQDDKGDWEAECRKMSSYYSNSQITISALEASDSSEGFLRHRTIDAVRVGDPSQGLGIRPKLRRRVDVFREAPLNSRGWVLQERLFATRILHFTEQEMFWECQTLSAREGEFKLDSVSAGLQSVVSAESEDFKRLLAKRLDCGFSEKDAFTLWMRIVRQYSRRSLTFSWDRLPAISSLAALFATSGNLKYLAGIWEDDLWGLAWFRDGPTHRISHQAKSRQGGQYLGPSWSWVAMSESVIYRFDDNDRVGSRTDPVVLDSDVQYDLADPFGRVLGASITLRVFVRTVQCLESTARTPESIASAHETVISSYVASKEEKNEAFESMPVNVFTEDGKRVGSAIFDRDREKDVPYQFEAVQICVTELPLRCSGSRKTRVTYFMLIEPCSIDSSTYRRVGAGVTRNFTTQVAFPSPFRLEKFKEIVLV